MNPENNAAQYEACQRRVLVGFILHGTVEDPRIAAEILRLQRGPLNRLLQSVIGDKEFRAAAHDQSIVERFHTVSGQLMSRFVEDVRAHDPDDIYRILGGDTAHT